MTDTKRLAAKIVSGKDTLDELLNILRGEIFFQGKTVSQWKEHFYVHIPSDLNTLTSRDIASKLADLFQEASFYFSLAETKVSITKSSGEESVREEYYRLVEDYKQKQGKVPAAATLDNLAKLKNSDVINATLLAEIERDFWKRIIDQLNYCRKVFETAAMNVAIEQKNMRDQL